jgi:hypothetical protein
MRLAPSTEIAPNNCSQTKVNRCLAEGRERFRAFLSRSESGGRCAELRPLLSAFCDSEADAAGAAVLREHLRACAHCRAALRAYRAAPRAAGALAPLPLAGRSLLDRLHDALGGLHSRLPGQGVAADSAVTQVAASGGARGAGMAGLAKLLAVCAGTAGGAAACVGAGVVPAPLDLTPDHRIASRPAPEADIATSGDEATATVPSPTEPAPDPGPRQSKPVPEEKTAAEPARAEPVPVEAGAVEYAPPPAPAAAEPASSTASAGSPAGEFGP